MKIKIYRSEAKGKVCAPPSKSIAHRALMCGAFSEGSTISNVAFSKDISATLGCLESLGAQIAIEDDKVKIGKLDFGTTEEGCVLDCNESGSTLRFMVPICLLTGKPVTLVGSERLFERPLTVYEDLCHENGFLFEKGINSLKVCGNLKSGDYAVQGDISSQFITGMLFALSLLEGESTLTVKGKYESRSYVDLTLSVMDAFGVSVVCKDNVYYVNGGQKYKSREYCVEGDCSNAAFLEGFNLLGGDVSVEGILQDTLQGDSVYLSMYKALQSGEKKFDLSDCPDLAPVMFAMAAYCGGAEFTGTARLKIKESDRASVMAEELKKFGVDVTVYDNSVVVHNCILKEPIEALNGHNDHRIVMALSLLCSVTGGEIDGAQAVSKSYPDFFEEIEKLGIKIEKR